MNWQRELEARLSDDPRLEQRKSRLAEGLGFFYKGKELAHFVAPASIKIRMSAASIFALGRLAAEESVKEVSKEGVLLRLESDADLDFAQKILERMFREKAGAKRPAGKSTNRGADAKKGAGKAFGDVQALKALKNLKVDSED